MSAGAEAAEDYRATLVELTGNDKMQINLLTILAEDYSEYSSDIVDALDKFLCECTRTLKIAVLYVVDSIIKNIPTAGDYRSHFQRRIVKMFVHVFKEGDEKTRSSLYKLRSTWGEIFSKGKLYEIDIKVKEIDRKWPVQMPATAPTPSQSAAVAPAAVVPDSSAAVASPTVGTNGTSAKQQGTVHLNPRFFNAAQASSGPLKSALKRPSPALTDADTDEKRARQSPAPARQPRTVMIVDPKELDGSQRGSDAAPPQLASRSNREGAKVKRRKEGDAHGKVKHRQGKLPHETKKASDDRRVPKRSDSTKEGKRREVVKKELQELSAADIKNASETTPAAVSSPPSTGVEKLSVKEEPMVANENERMGEQHAKEETVAAVTSLPAPFGRIPHLGQRNRQAPPQQQQQQQQQQQPPPSGPQQHFGRGRGGGHQPHSHGALATPTGSGSFEIRPSLQPGAHAFAVPPTTNIHPPVASGVGVTPMFAPAAVTNAGGFVPPPLGHPPPPHHMPPLLQMPPPMHGSRPPLIPQSHTITSDTPRFTGMPANNRIFVDGRAYEVMFLGDVAVIERNGLPHRVSFSGPPRNVIIDGVPYFMHFGMAKTVVIDGAEHVLRFGAPSRELYMGDFSFKGAFGGPPIVAIIDGRKHEIKLCGPPPEVKIEPEPSYELARHIQGLARESAPYGAPPPAGDLGMGRSKKEAAKKEADMIPAWLKRISQVAEKMKAAEEASMGSASSSRLHAQRFTPVAGRANSPPIPCSFRLESVERRAMPYAGLEKFSMRSLMIRYDSVIESVHQPRKVCPRCGITFHELNGAAYQAHSDWHFQEAIQAREKKYERSSPWYMIDEWFTYSETELVNRPPQSRNLWPGWVHLYPPLKAHVSATAEKLIEEQQAGATHSTDARSEDTSKKECCVCNEKFEVYWDDDDDVWKLKDSLVENGKAFHSYCKSDVDHAMSMDNDFTNIGEHDAAETTLIGMEGGGDETAWGGESSQQPLLTSITHDDPDPDSLSPIIKNVHEEMMSTTPQQTAVSSSSEEVAIKEPPLNEL